MSDLKPCPFCGGSVLLKKDHTNEGVDHIEHMTTPAECGLDSFSNFSYDTPVDDLWNARADAARITALEAERDRLVALFRDIRDHCQNDGLPNEMVLERVIERIEDTAIDALGGSHD